MLNNKKKFIYIAIAIVLVVAIATGTVFILKSSNKNSTTQTQTKTIPTKAATDSLVTDVLKIISTDPTKAKTMLQQASQQYKDLNDKYGVSNVKMLLDQIDYLSKKK